MRYTRPVIVLLLSLSLLGLGPSHQRVIDRVTGSVIRITAHVPTMTPFGPAWQSSTCTGFVIAPHRVLTAAHCLGEGMLADGLAVKILKVDHYYDLALLDVVTEKPALLLEHEAPLRGDPVTAIGYGFGFTRVTVIEGVVMLVDYQIPPDDLDGEVMPPTTFIQGVFIGGMSGGPIVDTNGHVIGIVQQSGEGIGLGVGTLLMRAFVLGAIE